MYLKIKHERYLITAAISNTYKLLIAIELVS